MFDVDAFRAAHQPWSFLAGGQRFVARHISADDLKRYLMVLAGGDQYAVAHELHRILRRAFPWRPTYLWQPDPVPLMLRTLPAYERQALLKDFFTMPGSEAAKEDAPADDAWEQLAAMNRAPADPDAKDGIPIEFATLQIEAHFGPGWYHNANRWPTADGVMPARLIWPYWHALQSIESGEVLRTTRGIALAFGGSDGKGDRLREQTIREAFPPSARPQLMPNKSAIYQVILTGEDAVSGVLDKAAANVKKFVTNIFTLGGALKGLAALGIGLSFGAIFKAAIDQIKAVQLSLADMRNAVTNAGGNFDAIRPQIEGTVDSVHDLSGATKDELRAALAGLITQTGNVSGSMQMLQTVADVAAEKHISLSEAAQLVGRAMNGNTKSFTELGIVVKAGENPLAALQARYKGFAENEGQGLSGTLSKIKEGWLTVLEAVGSNILQSDAWTKGTSVLVTFLSNLATWVDKNQKFIVDMADAVYFVADVGGRAFLPFLKIAVQALFGFIAAIDTGVTGLRELWALLNGDADAIDRLDGALNKRNLDRQHALSTMAGFQVGPKPTNSSSRSGTPTVSPQLTQAETDQVNALRLSLAGLLATTTDAKSKTDEFAQKIDEWTQKAQASKMSTIEQANALTILNLALGRIKTQEQVQEFMKLRDALFDAVGDAASKAVSDLNDKISKLALQKLQVTAELATATNPTDVARLQAELVLIDQTTTALSEKEKVVMEVSSAQRQLQALDLITAKTPLPIMSQAEIDDYGKKLQTVVAELRKDLADQDLTPELRDSLEAKLNQALERLRAFGDESNTVIDREIEHYDELLKRQRAFVEGILEGAQALLSAGEASHIFGAETVAALQHVLSLAQSFTKIGKAWQDNTTWTGFLGDGGAVGIGTAVATLVDTIVGQASALKAARAQLAQSIVDWDASLVAWIDQINNDQLGQALQSNTDKYTAELTQLQANRDAAMKIAGQDQSRSEADAAEQQYTENLQKLNAAYAEANAQTIKALFLADQSTELSIQEQIATAAGNTQLATQLQRQQQLNAAKSLEEKVELEALFAIQDAAAAAAKSAQDAKDAWTAFVSSVNGVGNINTLLGKSPTDTLVEQIGIWAKKLPGLNDVLKGLDLSNPADLATLKQRVQAYFNEIITGGITLPAGSSLDDVEAAFQAFLTSIDGVASGVESATDKMNAALSALNDTWDVMGTDDTGKAKDLAKLFGIDIGDISTQAGVNAAIATLQGQYASSTDDQMKSEIKQLIDQLRQITFNNADQVGSDSGGIQAPGTGGNSSVSAAGAAAITETDVNEGIDYLRQIAGNTMTMKEILAASAGAATISYTPPVVAPVGAGIRAALSGTGAAGTVNLNVNSSANVTLTGDPRNAEQAGKAFGRGLASEFTRAMNEDAAKQAIKRALRGGNIDL